MGIFCCYRSKSESDLYYNMGEKSWKKMNREKKKSRKKNGSKSVKYYRKCDNIEIKQRNSRLFHESETEIFYCEQGKYNFVKAGKEIHATEDGWHEIRTTENPSPIQSLHSLSEFQQTYDNVSNPRRNQSNSPEFSSSPIPMESPFQEYYSKNTKNISSEYKRRRSSKDSFLKNLETLEEEIQPFEEEDSMSPGPWSSTGSMIFHVDPHDYYDDSEVNISHLLCFINNI